MSAKTMVLNIAYVLLISSLFIFSAVQLYQSLYRNAVGAHMSTLKPDNVSPKVNSTTYILAQRIEKFPIHGANDIETKASLLEWSKFFEPTALDYQNIIELRLTSAKLRPTWSPNYIELSKLYDKVGNLPKQQEMLQYAQLFGAVRQSTIIGQLDFSYSNWNTLTSESKIQAAIQLIEVANRPAYRKKLDSMITYSKGKDRMCNLLFFNDLHVGSCY
ncbi:hypothetical protein [Vibrio europaeus]|uniref:hypothetical protein n=1 Tax=Vibrio europaeus TaxID=300876 RepID=UPI0039E10F7B